MAANLGTAYIPVKGDLSPLRKDLISAFLPGGVLGKIGKRGGLALGAGLAAGVGVAGIGKALFGLGDKFDEQFDRIRSSTGKTGESLDVLEDDFRDVVQSVPGSFGDAGTAVAGLAQRLNLTGGPLRRLSKQLLQLSQVTRTDVGENVESITRLFGDWGVATDQQAGTLDRLFRIMQKTGLSVSDNARLLVQFGAPLRQLGFDMDEAAVMFGKFEKEGVNLQTILPGFRFGLKNLSAPTKEAGELFEKLGINIRKGPAVALQEVFAAIKAAPNALKANEIAFAVFGKRAGPDMAAAVREGRFEYDNLIKSIRGGTDTIGKAEKDTRDFAQEWDLFKKRVMVGLEPLASKVFDTVGDGMAAISKNLGTVKALAKVMGILAAAFVTYRIAVGGANAVTRTYAVLAGTAAAQSAAATAGVGAAGASAAGAGAAAGGAAGGFRTLTARLVATAAAAYTGYEAGKLLGQEFSEQGQGNKLKGFTKIVGDLGDAMRKNFEEGGRPLLGGIKDFALGKPASPKEAAAPFLKEQQAQTLRATDAEKALLAARQQARATLPAIAAAEKQLAAIRKAGKGGTHAEAEAIRALDAAEGERLAALSASTAAQKDAESAAKRTIGGAFLAYEAAKKQGAGAEELAKHIRNVSAANSRWYATQINVKRAMVGLTPVTDTAKRNLGDLLRTLKGVSGLGAFKKFVINADISSVNAAVRSVTKLQDLGRVKTALRIIADSKTPEEALKRLRKLIGDLEDRQHRITMSLRDQATLRLEKLKRFVDRMPDKTLNFKADIELTRRAARFFNQAGLGQAGKMIMRPRAKGGKVGRDEPLTLVGEEGYELARLPGGKQTILGQQGPEIRHLPVNTRVFSHTETKRKLATVVEKVTRVLPATLEHAKQSVGRAARPKLHDALFVPAAVGVESRLGSVVQAAGGGVPGRRLSTSDTKPLSAREIGEVPRLHAPTLPTLSLATGGVVPAPAPPLKVADPSLQVIRVSDGRHVAVRQEGNLPPKIIRVADSLRTLVDRPAAAKVTELSDVRDRTVRSLVTNAVRRSTVEKDTHRATTRQSSVLQRVAKQIGIQAFAKGGVVGKTRKKAREIWEATAPFLPGAEGMPRLLVPKHMPKKDYAGWVDDETNRVSLSKGTAKGLLKGKDHPESVLIHEWAHTAQPRAAMKRWEMEGGAEAFTQRIAPKVYAKLGLPFKVAGTRAYHGFVNRVEREKNEDWIRRGQFAAAQTGPESAAGKPGPRAKRRADTRGSGRGATAAKVPEYREKFYEMARKAWPKVSDYFGRHGGMPVIHFSKDTAYTYGNTPGLSSGVWIPAGDAKRAAERSGPTEALSNYGLGTLVHEWAHIHQSDRETEGARKGEGGAEAFAKHVAPRVFPRYGQHITEYPGDVSWVRKNKGLGWILGDQFEGKRGDSGGRRTDERRNRRRARAPAPEEAKATLRAVNRVGDPPKGKSKDGIRETMRRVWRKAAKNYFAAGEPMPQINFPKHRPKNKELQGAYAWFSPDENRISFTQQAGRAFKRGSDFAESSLLHEWAHVFQRPDLDKWESEGGAESHAQRFAPRVFAAAKIPYKPGGQGAYPAYVNKVDRERSQRWLTHEQFGFGVPNKKAPDAIAAQRRGDPPEKSERGKRKDSSLVTAAAKSGAGAAMLRRARSLNAKRLPYKYGGNHGGGYDLGAGFDCSSAASYVLGIPARDAAGLIGYNAPGPGPVSIFAKGGGKGTAHAFLSLFGRGFGTSPSNPKGGPGWLDYNSRPGFSVSHAKGVHTPGKGEDGKPAKPKKITGGRLSLDQMVTLAKQAKFPDPALAAAIGFVESKHGQVRAHNTDGEDSRGLWQINVAPNANPKYKDWNLFDARVNAKAAYQISGGGKNWKPWTVYTSGAYKSFLGGKATPLPGAKGGGGPATSSQADYLAWKLQEAEATEGTTKDDLRWINRGLRYWRKVLRRNKGTDNFQRKSDALSKIVELREKKKELRDVPDEDAFTLDEVSSLNAGSVKWNIAGLQGTLDAIDLDIGKAALTENLDGAGNVTPDSYADDLSAATRLRDFWQNVYDLTIGKMDLGMQVKAVQGDPSKVKRLADGRFSTKVGNKTYTFSATPGETITVGGKKVTVPGGPELEKRPGIVLGTGKQQLEAATSLKSARDALRSVQDEMKSEEISPADAETKPDFAEELKKFLAAFARIGPEFGPNFKSLPSFAKGGTSRLPIALVGEEGYELAKPPGRKPILVGQEGPEVRQLPVNTRVFSHSETQRKLAPLLQKVTQKVSRVFMGTEPELAQTGAQPRLDATLSTLSFAKGGLVPGAERTKRMAKQMGIQAFQSGGVVAPLGQPAQAPTRDDESLLRALARLEAAMKREPERQLVEQHLHFVSPPEEQYGVQKNALAELQNSL